MKKKPSILDTNLLIRFLTNDEPTQAAAVETLLDQVPIKSFFIPDIVVAESVFVLQSRYNLFKEEIVGKISSLITYEKFITDRILLQKTIDIYSNYNISFVDAYLGALHAIGRNSTLYTFDKRLLNIPEIHTAKP